MCGLLARGQTGLAGARLRRIGISARLAVAVRRQPVPARALPEAVLLERLAARYPRAQTTAVQAERAASRRRAES